MNTSHKPNAQQLNIDELLNLRVDDLERYINTHVDELAPHIDALKTGVLKTYGRYESELLLDALDRAALLASAGKFQRDISGQDKPFVKWGISQAFHNKINMSGNSKAFGNSFTPTETDLEYLVQHVTSDGAWTPGFFAGKSRTKATWLQSEFLALDFDENTSVQDLLKIPFFEQSAFLIAPTASHTPEYAKTRAAFHLDRPITDIHEYESLQAGLIALYSHLSPDEKCKDAARMYYGSDVPGAYVNLDAVLPVDRLKALIADHLSRTTPSMKPAAYKTIRLDSEVGRLSLALDFSAHLRVWAITRAAHPDKWEIKAFWQEIEAHGIHYTKQHKNLLLREGEGVFWNVDRKTGNLYLIRPGDELTRRAQLFDTELVESNLPGLKRDIYIPITANLEEWNALIYAGWFAAKKQTDMTRAKLCQLFNCSKRTLIRWEKSHLGETVKVTPNIVQTDQTPEECNAPAHHYTYTVIVDGTGDTPAHTEKRTAWRLPNTYTSKIKVHKHNGQRKQILSLAKMAAGLQPSNEKGGGLPRQPRNIFTNSETALKAASASNEPVKVVIGRTKTGIRKSELTRTCVPTTSALECIVPATQKQWYQGANNA